MIWKSVHCSVVWDCLIWEGNAHLFMISARDSLSPCFCAGTALASAGTKALLIHASGAQNIAGERQTMRTTLAI